jgi:hypothetical protein
MTSSGLAILTNMKNLYLTKGPAIVYLSDDKIKIHHNDEDITYLGVRICQ